MECPNCKAPNPDGKKYCGDCGTPLKTIGDLSESDLRQRIQTTIRQELKDQKLVEVEVTEAIVARLTNWAKLLGFFAGIPLALLVFVLGGFGIKKYADLWVLIDVAEKNIGPVVERGKNQADEVAKQTESLRKQSEAVRKELTDLEPIIAKVKADSDSYQKTLDEKLATLKTGVDSSLRLIATDVQEIRGAIAKPGVDRWPVKTGQDGDRQLVGTALITKTVEDLTDLTRPTDLLPATVAHPAYQARRACPVECSLYSVEATIITLKDEIDGDYHMVLQGATGQTMVAEIPNPTPQFIGDSPWTKQIASARAEIDKKLVSQQQAKFSPVQGPGSLFAPARRWRARVVGVGFFDRVGKKAGVAQNGIELHPVIGVKFLE